MRTADELVEFIRERSHEVGTSLTKIEKEVGLSNGRIGKWKNQKRYPPHDTLVAIAALLKVSVKELTGEEQKENPTANGEVKKLTPDRYDEFLSELSAEELTELNAAMARAFAKRMAK